LLFDIAVVVVVFFCDQPEKLRLANVAKHNKYNINQIQTFAIYELDPTVNKIDIPSQGQENSRDEMGINQPFTPPW